jgi:hypothetical protein
MDILEQNDSQLQPNAAENVEATVLPSGEPEKVSDKDVDDNNPDEDAIDKMKDLTKEELIEKAREIVASAENPDSESRGEIEAVKHNFYRIINQEKEDAKSKFIAEGGRESDFDPVVDTLELAFKDILTEYKKKRQAEFEREETEKQNNLDKKKNLILALGQLIENTDDFGKKVPAFQKLQQEWKSIGMVPATDVAKIRETYQGLVETFYDGLKINNEMRDYDFKKNLEAKTKLCESAEALDAETDVVNAFKKLQLLHEEWGELGPVAKDLRETIWNRFKAASTVINKKHAEFFNKLRAAETDNLAKKTEICEKIEAIDFSKLASFKEWQDQSKVIIDLQGEWRKVGFAPKKFNTTIYERFRAACDKFFNAKGEYFKSVKANFADNLAKKVALCEQAEALKDNTDWKETTEKLVELQKEWKTIGSVSKKQSDLVWKRFISACDAFFDAKSKQFKERKSEEQVNLDKKKELIEKIQTLDTATDTQAAADTLRALIKEWNAVGHVPFKEKDALYKSYKAAIDEKFDVLNMKVSSSPRNSSRSVSDSKSDGSKLARLKASIATYENNIGFLASSKSSSALKDVIEKKIAEMRKEIAQIENNRSASSDATDEKNTK